MTWFEANLIECYAIQPGCVLREGSLYKTRSFRPC